MYGEKKHSRHSEYLLCFTEENHTGLEKTWLVSKCLRELSLKHLSFDEKNPRRIADVGIKFSN